MLQYLLQTFGIDSDCAIGGSEAVKMVQQRFEMIEANPGKQISNYKLIFMDFSMQGMDGIDTSLAIQNLFIEKGIDPFDTK